MPCFKREKSLDFHSRRDPNNGRDVMAPKPVRPRSIRYHGLFSMSIAAQHLVVDKAWSPDSLTEQFANYGELLQRRLTYKWHETAANRQKLLVESKRLKSQCNDGRIKLQKISTGNNAHAIRNFLIKHRDMQRLYQRMPIHLVEDNINQRTFTLRKERDRLTARLNQLKKHYRSLLVERAKVENLIRYENEFVLEEELISRVLLKKIENSTVRFRAIKVINTTYKKMAQVLLQDEIFYEPILRSLSDDIEDQANFIKHIIYMGMPAIAKFKDLNREFREMEKKARANISEKLQIISSLKKPVVPSQPGTKEKEYASADPKRYVRETMSMMAIRMELHTIEKTIKELKLEALCSQAREIYPRLKWLVEENIELDWHIKKDMQLHEKLEMKMKCASTLQGVLVNNLSEEEINRLERIKKLKDTLKNENEFELDTLNYLKDRADIYVTLRMNLWNMLEILRHVENTPKLFRSTYPNTYLRLPLLKFELLEMSASPPEIFNEDHDVLMTALKRKTHKLMKHYQHDMGPKVADSRNKYHIEMLSTINTQDKHDQEDEVAIEDDLLQDKTMFSIPSRKQIKAQSAKLIENAKTLEV